MGSHGRCGSGLTSCPGRGLGSEGRNEGLSPLYIEESCMGEAMYSASLTTRAIKLLEDVLLAGTSMTEQLALTRVVNTITATHSTIRGPKAGSGTQA